VTRFLYDRLRAEVAELRRRLSVVASTTSGGGPHASNHENGGSDEIDVTGLSGVLADPQTPAAHATTHQDLGADEINVAGLSGQLADAQLVGVRKNSTGSVFTRSRLNFIEGSNVTLTVADDGTEVDVTIAASGSGGITELTGDVTAGPGSGSQAATIPNDTVTNAQLANMAQATIKGRADGAGTGDPTDLTPDQVSTILDGATDPFVRTSAAGGFGSPVGPELEATIGATFTGTDIAVGKQRIIRVPYGFLPLTWVVYTDATISIVIDIWADTLANYPPADADTITGGNEPEIAGGLIDDGDASAFDPIVAGDFVTFNIDSVTVGSATWVTVQLIGTRT
jgi:hypothetical protein